MNAADTAAAIYALAAVGYAGWEVADLVEARFSLEAVVVVVAAVVVVVRCDSVHWSRE